VLRYAHEHGCPWGSSTCSGAAVGGHLEVLRYAYEHGCPLDFEFCRALALGRHAELLTCRDHAMARGLAEVAEYGARS
jgi:hypothetical protein